ncbi:MAG: AAA family ATPase [Candidatus Limnocylindrales bacterium]
MLIGSPPLRVYITGVSGAGKSTLARRIGAAFDLPVYHLDEVARDLLTGQRRSHDERLAMVAAIAATPCWVAEGVQTGWTDELCERAELIVWLDQLAGSQAMIRIARRFTRQAFLEFRRQRGRRRFLRVRSYAHHTREFLRSLREVRAFNRGAPGENVGDGGNRAATAAQLGRHRAKVVQCRTAAHIEDLLLSIEAVRPPRRDVPGPT